MKNTIKIIQVPDAFMLFNEAMGVFHKEVHGFASFYGELGMVEYCADYIANKDEKRFLEDTELEFGFDKKSIKKIIKNYEKSKRELYKN